MIKPCCSQKFVTSDLFTWSKSSRFECLSSDYQWTCKDKTHKDILTFIKPPRLHHLTDPSTHPGGLNEKRYAADINGLLLNINWYWCTTHLRLEEMEAFTLGVKWQEYMTLLWKIRWC